MLVKIKIIHFSASMILLFVVFHRDCTNVVARNSSLRGHSAVKMLFTPKELRTITNNNTAKFRTATRGLLYSPLPQEARMANIRVTSDVENQTRRRRIRRNSESLQNTLYRGIEYAIYEGKGEVNNERKIQTPNEINPQVARNVSVSKNLIVENSEDQKHAYSTQKGKEELDDHLNVNNPEWDSAGSPASLEQYNSVEYRPLTLEEIRRLSYREHSSKGEAPESSELNKSRIKAIANSPDIRNMFQLNGQNHLIRDQGLDMENLLSNVLETSDENLVHSYQSLLSGLTNNKVNKRRLVENKSLQSDYHPLRLYFKRVPERHRGFHSKVSYPRKSSKKRMGEVDYIDTVQNNSLSNNLYRVIIGKHERVWIITSIIFASIFTVSLVSGCSHNLKNNTISANKRPNSEETPLLSIRLDTTEEEPPEEVFCDDCDKQQETSSQKKGKVKESLKSPNNKEISSEEKTEVAKEIEDREGKDSSPIQTVSVTGELDSSNQPDAKDSTFSVESNKYENSDSSKRRDRWDYELADILGYWDAKNIFAADEKRDISDYHNTCQLAYKCNTIYELVSCD